MRVRVSKWGNSLGVRLPGAMARQIGVHDGAKVDITAEGRRLMIEAAPPRWRLEDLLVNMTPEVMREDFDWGADVGRARVDD